jgi:hypothetical protein
LKNAQIKGSAMDDVLGARYMLFCVLDVAKIGTFLLQRAIDLMVHTKIKGRLAHANVSVYQVQADYKRR